MTNFKLIDKAQQKAQGSCEIYPLRLSELVVVHWTYFCHKKLEASLYLLKPLSEFTPLYCYLNISSRESLSSLFDLIFCS